MTQTLLQQPIVSREEWLIARNSVLVQEEAAAAEQQRATEARRQMPMVEITTPYTFEGPNGEVTLLDLFEDRQQLVIYHFMFAPEWEQGCKYCSFMVDNLVHLEHLHAHNTSLAVISRAPLSKIEPFKERMGWTFPWYSSIGNDFNLDLGATIVSPANGETPETKKEIGGTSVFVRDGDRIFHTYSTFGPETEFLDGVFNWLDLTPLGRQDGINITYHDRYQS